MLQCLTFKSPSAATSTSIPNSPPPTGDLNHHTRSHDAAAASNDGTPVSTSSLQSPAINLTREYTLYLQSNSFNEMYLRIHKQEIRNGEIVEIHVDPNDDNAHELGLAQLLHPNRQCVEDALRNSKPNNTLNRLVSNYFDHSESLADLCLLLRRSVFRARSIYSPIHSFIQILPTELDLLTQSQCDHAYEMFRQLDCCENPFPCPESDNFHVLRHSFSELRQELDIRLHKSRSRVHYVRRATIGSALCVIGSAVAITLTALAIATHALVAIVACPFCAVASLPKNLTKKELARVKQLDAAARGTFVLKNFIDSIDCGVTRLYEYIEHDKDLIRLGLERGSDRHLTSEILKYLRKNLLDFNDQLKHLEENIYLYFSAVNRARNLLLQEIHACQTCNS